MKKISKFTIASLLALIAGHTAGTGGTVHAQTAKSPEDQFKKEVMVMSLGDIEKAIDECNKVLKQLRETIDSDETGAEKRHEARIAFDDIARQRDILQKRQAQIKREQAKTIDIRDAVKSR